MISSSDRYRDDLHYLINELTTREEHDAILMGKHANDLLMNDLEAAGELLVRGNPRNFAPDDYKPRMGSRK